MMAPPSNMMPPTLPKLDIEPNTKANWSVEWLMENRQEFLAYDEEK